jgi:hypothetical protein
VDEEIHSDRVTPNMRSAWSICVLCCWSDEISPVLVHRLPFALVETRRKKKKIHRFGTITLHYIKSTQLGVAARVANRKATVDIIELREIMSRMAAPHKNSFM